ncbi:MAG: stage III sporulation protein AF [Firmicutes bacterium]|nr:stage III sporulation protein AF [Bacillota bacterium]
MEWIRGLVTFLLVSGLLLMVIPDSDLKGFLRFIVGLLLIALMIGPLVGEGVLGRLEELVMNFDKYNLDGAGAYWATVDTPTLEERARDLLGKGSDVMWEHMEKQTNRQLGSMLSLLTGIDEAQVVSQINSKGELERVVVQLRLSEGMDGEENALPLTVQDGEMGHTVVEPVEPVAILGGAPSMMLPCSPTVHAQVAERAGSWVADFYDIDESQVTVSILR